MKIKTFVVCVAAGLAASLSLQAEQVIVTPSQGGDVRLQPRPLVNRVLKGQPYSADVTNESVQALSDGNRIVHRTTGRVYRDVEGRTRREEDRPSGDPSISISDPVANLSWTLNPSTKTAREMPGLNLTDFFVIDRALGDLYATMKPFAVSIDGQTVGDLPRRITGNIEVQGVGQGVARGVGGGGRGGSVEPANTTQVAPRGGGVGGGRGGRGAGATDERVEEPLPNKSIENLLCSGVRRTTTIPKGAIGNEQPIKIVSEEWTSIDLQVLVLTDLNDPRSGHSTYKLTNVRRADPDLSLFRVPGDYTITRGGGGRGRGGN